MLIFLFLPKYMIILYGNTTKGEIMKPYLMKENIEPILTKISTTSLVDLLTYCKEMKLVLLLRRSE